MFTGLVEKVGKIGRVSRGRGLVLEIVFEPWATPLEEGESVAVNGVCLTVARRDASRFTADVLRETEERSTLGGLKPGDRVNLERAVRAGAPLGGHIVQGHVDGRGKVLAKIPRGRDFRLKIGCSRVLAAQSILKGSVAIDGVSLTISGLGEDWLMVDVIPSTAGATTLGAKRPGDSVNLETDALGKYAARATPRHASGLTFDMLARAGFGGGFE